MSSSQHYSKDKRSPEGSNPHLNRAIDEAGIVSSVELSIVMPCLNEALTLPTCINKAQSFLSQNQISGEVIVADNGSTDGSQEIAQELGATVIPVKKRGYGAALAGGIANARGRYVIMGDCDDSYDFTALKPFVDKLRAGEELVMGNRFLGGISPGAMPPLHRYFGNPLLTWIGRLFFKSRCGDFYCGLRGFNKDAYEKLNLHSAGMEFALEMVVKATAFGLKTTEVPTTLSPDGRDRPPHLRSWRDGWRSLRLYLLYSPKWLFWYPALLLMLLGIGLGVWLLPGPRTFNGITLDVHTLAYSAAAIVLGFQAAIFALLAKLWALDSGMHPPSPKFERLIGKLNLEPGLFLGFLLALIGLGGSIWALGRWSHYQFGDLNPFQTMRIVIPSVLLMTLGCQTMLFSFYFSLLTLSRNRN